MSLNSILSTATSGLLTAQTGLNIVSTNIANVNTPGYIQEALSQTPLVNQGSGVGVGGVAVLQAASQYLKGASLSASGDASAASIISNMLSQSQSLFGDPTSTTGYFSTLNSVFTAFASAANDPASNLTQTQAVNQVSQFLSQSKSIGASLAGLGSQADANIGADVTQVNQYLSQISALNKNITQATSGGSDASSARDAQNELLNKLSSLVDINVTTAASGAITIRTTGGSLLVSPGGAATLAYQPASNGVGELTSTQPSANAPATAIQISSGEIGGLLNLRSTQLPAIASQFSELVSQTVNAINAASNASSSVPAPATLTGQDTGLDLPTAVGNFTGKTNVVIVNSSGVVQQSVAIDFGAGTMTVGGVASAFTPSTFLSSLNTALGGAGTASFANGALSLSATGTGNGVVVADDSTNPSSKAGQGFSQYFGLNNLISSSAITNYQTGLTPSDASGFTGSITLSLTAANGSLIKNVTVTPPTGGTMQNLLDALNSPTSGVGVYGQFSLDSKGTLSFSPATPGAASLSVLSDQTQRGSGGPSMTELFGLGQAQQASRVQDYSVNAAITANPGIIPFAQADLSAGVGQPILSAGDNSGANLLAAANTKTLTFNPAGYAPQQSSTVTQYASQLAGQIGLVSSNAAQASTNAQAIQTEASTQLQSVEGVNLDQQLVNLTTYQQAYSSSARLLQATTDMFTALMNVVP